MREFELEPGEHIVLQTRKHWFLFLADLLPYALLATLPFALPNILAAVPPLAAHIPTIDTQTRHLMLGIWLLLVWTGAWSSFTRYFLNAWILTNQRIVEIKQRHYFDREVSSLFLNRVQDVSTEVIGIIRSLLGIGRIQVQSAGATEKFCMRDIPRPELLRDLILKYVSEKHGPTGV